MSTSTRELERYQHAALVAGLTWDRLHPAWSEADVQRVLHLAPALLNARHGPHQGTLLHVVVCTWPADSGVPMTRFLLRAKADVNACNELGHEPLVYAANKMRDNFSKALCGLLLDYGATYNIAMISLRPWFQDYRRCMAATLEAKTLSNVHLFLWMRHTHGVPRDVIHMIFARVQRDPEDWHAAHTCARCSVDSKQWPESLLKRYRIQ